MEHERAKFNARVREILQQKHKDELITVPMVEDAVRIVNIAFHKERIEYHMQCVDELENQATIQKIHVNYYARVHALHAITMMIFHRIAVLQLN